MTYRVVQCSAGVGECVCVGAFYFGQTLAVLKEKQAFNKGFVLLEIPQMKKYIQTNIRALCTRFNSVSTCHCARSRIKRL